MVTASRRLLALALVAGLTLMNVQAAELHVHATADHVDEDHQHGPASHHHDDIDHQSPAATEVAAVDADDTVVHVSLVAASTQSIKPLPAAYSRRRSLTQALPQSQRAHALLRVPTDRPRSFSPRSAPRPPSFLCKRRDRSRSSSFSRSTVS